MCMCEGGGNHEQGSHANVSTSGRKLVHIHTLFTWGNATAFLNQSQSASLRKCRVSLGTFGPRGKLSKLPEHGKKNTKKEN